MNKIKNRAIPFWAFPFIGLLIILSMVGCAKTPEATPETPTPEVSEPSRPTATPTREAISAETQPTIEVDPADLDGISIRFIHLWPGEAGEVLEDIGMKFSLSNPWGIWVDVVAQGSETLLLDNVQSEIDSGDVPALIAVHAYNLSLLEGDYASAPLTDYVNDPQWGIDAETLADIPPIYLDQFAIEGQLIALPVAPQPTVLFYNQTWAEELGFESYPADEKTFEDQSCAAASANLADEIEDNDFLGGFLMNYESNVLLSWYTAFGGDLPQDGPPQFNDDAGQTAFGYLESLFSTEKNCIWEGRQPEPYLYFGNRYALMYAGTLDQIPVQLGWMAHLDNDDQWTTMGLPGSEKEVMMVNGPGLFLSETTPEEQLAAWLFAKHLITPEVQARIVESMFTLPVREDAIDLLDDFRSEYPQWTAALERVEDAELTPISEGWGYSRWVLEDGIRRLFAINEEAVGDILTQIDAMILEIGGEIP